MIYKRQYGLFSNINVFQRLLLENEISKIEFILTEYYDNLDLYPFLFQINNSIEINKENSDYLLKNCLCTEHGLFNKKVDLTKINVVKNKYLNLSTDVLNYYNHFRINEKYLFVWFRSTDKITENTIPSFDKFIDFILEKNKDNLQIVLKTDSKDFLNYFSKRIGNFLYLEAIKITNNADYLELNKIEDSDFKEKYGIFKFQYLQKLLAITKVASESEIYIATNSNINTFVIQQRENFKNVFVFKNENELINYQ